ncbi:MAG TPA: CHAP domain-containing protein [Candidatus Saccharimonadales bacterium]|nr:CHAP domain-containing protein [Candidatus Saccharimonadales bacterium]
MVTPETRNSSRNKKLNIALLSSHVAVVLGIIGLIGLNYRAPVEAGSSSQARSFGVLDEAAAPSVDQIVAADVATAVAQVAKLPVESNVQSLSISLAGKTELAQTESDYVTKPQIVQTETGRAPITTYVTVDGDNVNSVAAKFGISEDTVRWANNLTSDALTSGKELKIAGTTGVVYTVKAGDAVDGLASKYQSDKDRIVSYNDLELSGLIVGSQIVLPGGVLPENERPGYVAPRTSGSVNVAYVAVQPTVYAGNKYAYGYCTWYAYNRRAELGQPIGSNWGNAATWATYARAGGFRVDKTPEPGAVFQTAAGWYGFGHVGIVERVNGDGSFVTSEMNYGGWNRISSRTISAAEAGQYNYIH